MKDTPTLVVVMATCALATLATLATACGDPSANNSLQTTPSPSATDPTQTPAPESKPAVTMQTSYTEALRTASLKLIGDLPALADIKAISTAGPEAVQKAAYEAIIDRYLADPRFATTQIDWWRNTLKTGADPDAVVDPKKPTPPSFDTAATFAAEVVVEGRSYADLLTATSNTCPTFASGKFTPASCTNGAATAGVLTDPGLMAQFTSNMAFRRVRFVQETFACSKFPAEVVQPGTPMGGGTYTSPWDFNSIAGGPGSNIDFHDTSAAICANCHTSINHLAPLFGNFDEAGKMTASIQVSTPITPAATTVFADWLPAGQQTAWRNGVPAADLPALGAAMAKDPEVARCAVTRIWNWAFSRGDVVNDGAAMPAGVIESLQSSFVANQMKVQPLIRSVFTSDDFTRF